MTHLNVREQFGYLTDTEFSELTGYSPRTLANWRAKRIGPSFVRLPGKPPLYPQAEALAWLNARRVDTGDT